VLARAKEGGGYELFPYPFQSTKEGTKKETPAFQNAVNLHPKFIMAKAITGFTITKPHMLSTLQKTKLDLKPCSGGVKSYKPYMAVHFVVDNLHKKSESR
jgi:hypothetical protein